MGFGVLTRSPNDYNRPTMSNGETNTLTDLQALEQFVVENDELLQLEERIGRFNIFDALRIVDAEIRHSNFLAWLLDPNESHGQGPLFLKAILMDLLSHSPPELRPKGLSPVLVDGAELRGVDIRREWRNIDILIVCKAPAFVIAIENKVKAGKNNPFEKYEKRVREAFPDSPSMFVLLTVDGSELEELEWAPYSYENIHHVLSRIRKANAASIGDDVLAFLDHYIRLIGSRFMEDANIDELCRTIYKNHRQAIDLIVEHTVVGRSEALSAIEDHIRSDKKRWVFLNSTTREIAVLPKAWYDVMPGIGSRPRKDPKAWLWWNVWCYNGSCTWRLCCGIVKNEKLRERIVEVLTDPKSGFGLKPRKKVLSPGWNSLGRRNIEKWDEEEPDPAALIAKLDKVLEKVDREMAGVPKAIKSVVG